MRVLYHGTRRADLVTAVRDGLIAGAGLDVYEDEPRTSGARPWPRGRAERMTPWRLT